MPGSFQKAADVVGRDSQSGGIHQGVATQTGGSRDGFIEDHFHLALAIVGQAQNGDRARLHAQKF